MLPLEIGGDRHREVFHARHVFRIESLEVSGRSRFSVDEKLSRFARHCLDLCRAWQHRDFRKSHPLKQRDRIIREFLLPRGWIKYHSLVGLLPRGALNHNLLQILYLFLIIISDSIIPVTLSRASSI